MQSVYKQGDTNIYGFRCLSIYFSFSSAGEERTLVALFGQSFAAVWSECESETESDRLSLCLGVVSSVSISL